MVVGKIATIPFVAGANGTPAFDKAPGRCTPGSSNHEIPADPL
jgi:hypothetical protein